MKLETEQILQQLATEIIGYRLDDITVCKRMPEGECHTGIRITIRILKKTPANKFLAIMPQLIKNMVPFRNVFDAIVCDTKRKAISSIPIVVEDEKNLNPIVGPVAIKQISSARLLLGLEFIFTADILEYSGKLYGTAIYLAEKNGLN